MLDKRRFTFGWLISATSYFVLCIVALMFTGCLSIWVFGGVAKLSDTWNNDEATNPSYLLLLPTNTSEATQSYTYTSDLPYGDESTLIDMKNFRFTMNHDTCNKTQPLLLTMIHSSPSNFQKREVVRKTWGRYQENIAVLFFVGLSTEFQNKLVEEDQKYGDLIQGNFMDAYRNMTYKHVMALKYATYYCPSAKYILKLDDDVFVHMPALLEFLKRGLSPWGARRLILCDPLASSMVKRSWRSKWRVSPREYPGKQYPDYCAGWAILYSPDSAFLLYREAQREPYFWIDDVHITGIIAKKVNLTHTSIHSLVLSNPDMHNLLDDPTSNHKDFIFGPPNLSEYEIMALHVIVSAKLT